MSNYKYNDKSNRDALFGPSSSSSKGASKGPKYAKDNNANRDALFGSASGGSSDKKKKSTGARRAASGSGDNSNASRSRPTPSSSSSSAPRVALTGSTAATSSASSTSRGYQRGTTASKAGVSGGTGLTGAAKMAKIKEAESYRDQATKAMQKGLFARPDPLAAANFYRRAADLYGQAGENRLERLHRIAGADCQMGQGSYPMAALEYIKAAELSRVSDEKPARKRKEGYKLYSDAARAYTNCDQYAKAANAQMKAALALTWEDETTMLDKETLNAVEVAVESHVPDVLNVFARYRQTGQSKYVDAANPHAPPSDDTLALAKDHAISAPYVHEPLQEMVYTLVHYGEYQSALYTCGAASYILENDGVSTLTLSRNYVMETILQLAMGDPVAAEESFLQRHVQRTHYLSSRECKLAEELVRAVLRRDIDALEEARDPRGSNKSAMAHLNANLRALIHQLRISGVARRGAGGEQTTKTGNVATESLTTRGLNKQPVVDDDSEEERPNDDDDDDDDDGLLDADKMEKEMDDLMAGLDELGELGGEDSDEGLGEFDDDDIDLR